MITYNDIYEILRKEKYSELLQPLDKKFVFDVSEYLREKKEVSEKKDDMFSDTTIKNKKQLENAISIFKELVLRRKKKLLNLAFIARETGISKRDFDNMLDFEREMFDRIVKAMEDSDNKITNQLSGDSSEKKSNILVMFKEAAEEFMGMDGEMIGPFDKGEISNLPEEIVKILIDAGKVEIVEE